MASVAFGQGSIRTAGAPAPEYDRSLAWAALLLVALGLVMVYSASIATAEASRYAAHNPAYFLLRHAVFLALALAAATAVFLMPLRYWQKGAPWLFAAWGSPGESAAVIDWIVTELYGEGSDGLPGNDDGGTMSAWLLFAGAGLYPVAGTDRYIVAAPRYAKMVLHRASGDLTIEAKPAPSAGLSPKRVSLDGKALSSNTISHAELSGTHTLRFELAKQ